MKYWTRRKGSQRAGKPREVKVEPNFAGQGGLPFMALLIDGVYHCIQPETEAEVSELQSQAAILRHNVRKFGYGQDPNSR